MRRLAVCAAAIASGRAPALAQLPCSYTVTVVPNADCGILGSQPLTPVAINNLGHVLLTGTGCAGPNTDTFLWTGGPSLTLIPRPAGMISFSGNDLNDNDVVCGEAWYASGGLRAVIYDHGSWTILLPLNPPDGWSSAASINNNNEVCGYRSIGSRADPVNPQTAFSWSSRAGFSDLGIVDGYNTTFSHISEDGRVCGWAGIFASTAGTRGLIEPPNPPTVLPPIPDGTGSACTSITDGGVACGYGKFPLPTGDVVRAFVWQAGQISSLGVLPGMLRSFALDVANDITVVGYCRTMTGGADVSRGFAWRAGTMADLESMVEPAVLSAVTSARGINDTGQIVAQARTTTNHVVSVVLTPVSLNAGDLNHDCRTDVNDLLIVIAHWGQAFSIGDANHDGSVDVNDLLVVIGNWSQ
jgi:uncharacterized membrane protein